MKKMKVILAGIAMMSAVMLFPKQASAAGQVPVTTVQDITDVQTVSSTNIQVPTGEYSNVVKFTLTKPAYVYVSGYSTVMHQNFHNLGSIDEFAVYSDANCSNMVKSDKMDNMWANERKSKYMCLDAGNYWVYFAKARGGSNNADSYGTVRLSVAAQYLNVTGTKNGSWARAKKISTDKNVTGFLSSSTRTSWYKFTVANGTAAKLKLSLENPLGESLFPTDYTGVTLYRSNHKVIERLNIDETYYESAYSKNLELSSGIYYLAVTGDSAYTDSWSPTKLKKTSKNNMGMVNLRITTVKKVSLSKVTNVRGKKAQVSYKAVSGAKGYEVQYSTDKKFKKSVKTKKLNAKTTKVTLTKLTKGKRYYVRVRAYRYDTDGNKVTGVWSTAKNVKITK